MSAERRVGAGSGVGSGAAGVGVGTHSTESTTCMIPFGAPMSGHDDGDAVERLGHRVDRHRVTREGQRVGERQQFGERVVTRHDVRQHELPQCGHVALDVHPGRLRFDRRVRRDERCEEVDRGIEAELD